MRTNVDNLAIEDLLKMPDEKPGDLTEEYERFNLPWAKTMSKYYILGFNKCFELVKPLLEKAIEDFKAEYDDIEEYMHTYEKLEKFLEKYKT